MEKESSKQWLRFAIVLSLCFVIGLVWGLVSNKAIGAEEKTCAYEPGQQCTIDAANWSKRKFKHGKMGRTDGFTPSKVYKAPKKAKHIMVRKTLHALNKAGAFDKSSTLVQDMSRHARSGDVFTLCDMATDNETDFRRCVARTMYEAAQKHSSCVHKLGYTPYVLGKDMCNPLETGSSFHKPTTSELKNFGSVVICGSTLALTVATAPGTGGGSAAAWSAFMGPISCGWGVLIGSS